MESTRRTSRGQRAMRRLVGAGLLVFGGSVFRLGDTRDGLHIAAIVALVLGLVFIMWSVAPDDLPAGGKA